jgi:peptidoglycan/LPS O-acetylase OafA/YrhL
VQKRLLELDVFRGIAAVAVVFCHYSSLGKNLSAMSYSFHWGSYGPHLFFIISGFVIFMTLGRTRAASDFVASRVSRLYPIYWFAVLFTYLLVVVWPQPGESVSFSQMLVNLTMCQTWLRVPDISSVYWTLAVELKFYALMLLLFMCRGLNRVETAGFCWLLLILEYRVLEGLWGIAMPTPVRVVLTVDYAHLFIAGMMFYRLKTEGNTYWRHFVIACCLAMQAFYGGLEAVLMVSSFFVLFYLAIWDRLSVIAIRPLVWLGTISYSLYLIHGGIGDVMMPWLRGLWDTPAVLLLGPLAVSVIVAAGMTFWIERPGMRLVRGFYGKIRERIVGCPIPSGETNSGRPS